MKHLISFHLAIICLLFTTESHADKNLGMPCESYVYDSLGRLSKILRNDENGMGLTSIYYYSKKGLVDSISDFAFDDKVYTKTILQYDAHDSLISKMGITYPREKFVLRSSLPALDTLKQPVGLYVAVQDKTDTCFYLAMRNSSGFKISDCFWSTFSRPKTCTFYFYSTNLLSSIININDNGDSAKTFIKYDSLNRRIEDDLYTANRCLGCPYTWANQRSYSYDKAGRLSFVSDQSYPNAVVEIETPRVQHYRYDKNGHLIAIEFWDSKKKKSSGTFETYKYDANGKAIECCWIDLE